jgi:hypothetical protein
VQRSLVVLTLATAMLVLVAFVGCFVRAVSLREDESPSGFARNTLPVVEPGIMDVANAHLPAVKIFMQVPDGLGSIARGECSGVLIHPGLAVTAAHCFCAPRVPAPTDAPPPAMATRPERRKRKTVLTRASALQDVVISDIIDSRSSCTPFATVWTAVFETPGEHPQVYPYPGKVLIHPDFEMILGIKHGEKKIICDNADIAVVRLNDPVLLDFQPVTLSDTEAKVGDAVVVVGYSSNGEESGSFFRQFGDNEVTEIMEWDTGEVILGAAVAPGPEYPAPARIRNGDSGGPCVRREKRNVLMGIAIADGVTEAGRPISYCTSIIRHTAWLSEIVRRFGSAPDAGVSIPR